MRHPAHFLVKFMLVREPNLTDAQVMKNLEDWGFLTPPEAYLGFTRQELNPQPPGFDPANRLHRPSMQYLREQQIYELFYPTSAVEEAWSIVSDPERREVVEQILLSRLDLKLACGKVNKKMSWHLTESALQIYRHFFWNVPLLTFDEWGRYLYDRSAMYDRYMALLHAPPQLAYFHLRLDQVLESKKMIQRAQEIAYFALEEVNLQPGIRADKVKAIGVLTKALNDCHQSLSTSDMALAGVFKEFERFRMTHPEPQPPSILQLAPKGNYTGSGLDPDKKKEPQSTH